MFSEIDVENEERNIDIDDAWTLWAKRGEILGCYPVSLYDDELKRLVDHKYLHQGRRIGASMMRNAQLIVNSVELVFSSEQKITSSIETFLILQKKNTIERTIESLKSRGTTGCNSSSHPNFYQICSVQMSSNPLDNQNVIAYVAYFQKNICIPYPDCNDHNNVLADTKNAFIAFWDVKWSLGRFLWYWNGQQERSIKIYGKGLSLSYSIKEIWHHYSRLIRYLSIDPSKMPHNFPTLSQICYKVGIIKQKLKKYAVNTSIMA